MLKIHLSMAYELIYICLVATVQAPNTQQPKRSAGPPVVISTEKFNQTHGERDNPTTNSRTGSNKPNSSPHSTSFFGIKADGEKFVFVVDNSTSMLDGNRRGLAHSELMRALRALKWPQQYYVIAFDNETLALPFGPFVPAGANQSRKVSQWLNRLTPHDGTLPGNALRQAMGLRPDAVFLITDGQFETPQPATIQAWNKFQVPIHVIDMAPGDPVGLLEQIARESGGLYRKRP